MYERVHPERKPAARTVSDSDDRILVGRREAARMLSISQRSIDYLVANRQLNVRRIGGRVLIPVNELRRYARADHPKPLAPQTKSSVMGQAKRFSREIAQRHKAVGLSAS